MVVAAMTPSIDSGWSKDYPGTKQIKGFAYDQSTSFLYTYTYYTEQFNIFLNVPMGTATQMIYLQIDPDVFYQQAIAHNFPQCLLTEACTSLLTEDGKYLVI